MRDDTKYDRVEAFARALPRIRRRVGQHLAAPGLPRDKVLAAATRLLETTFIRVGNLEYARENDSFGLTTLRDGQVRVRGGTLRFEFRGKSGVEHSIELADPRLALIVRRMQDLPGEELLQYVDERGATRTIQSADVNAYIREIAGAPFTSKDFRTWAGTRLAALALQRLGPCISAAEAKRNLNSAIDQVARRLGNTKAVCRKCYIHPAIMESYLQGDLCDTLRGQSETRGLVTVLRKRRRIEREKARSGTGARSLAPVLNRSLARRLHRHGPAVAVGAPASPLR
jgi:DNA topoisomerase I